jgi:hypothetical protein
MWRLVPHHQMNEKWFPVRYFGCGIRSMCLGAFKPDVID